MGASPQAPGEEESLGPKAQGTVPCRAVGPQRCRPAWPGDVHALCCFRRAPLPRLGNLQLLLPPTPPRRAPTVANSAPASQHQTVDEIAITIYANDGTDDGGGGNNSESCAICLEDFAAGEELRVLPRCKHAFHKDCIDPWLLAQSKSTCPLCRDPVVVTRPMSDRDLDRDSDDNTDNGFPTVDSLMNFYRLYGDDESFGIDDDSISVFFSEI
uniref:RING-type E3 ubiquitin transferase n=1 Tax=Ananas comosus var. bracteatus TaxID=296719 RepID=A0A6V7Q4V3_ANACO|nr:unnamed protein product [Ananas comosus var. bracteatus]